MIACQPLVGSGLSLNERTFQTDWHPANFSSGLPKSCDFRLRISTNLLKALVQALVLTTKQIVGSMEH